jgi:hypothetical protein
LEVEYLGCFVRSKAVTPKTWRNSGDSEWLGWMIALFLVMILGIIAILAYAYLQSSGKRVGVGGVGFLLAGGCLLLGGLAGFLFGIPRSLQEEDAVDRANGTISRSSGPRYRVNTNLEQISDWLTKILIGVGLTQLGQIPDYLRDGAGYLEGALGGAPYGAPLALWVILYFSSCGFLFGYLWTRLFLTRALVEADVGAVIAAEVKRAQKDQAQIDAEALSLTYRYLRPDSKLEEFDISELKRAIKASQAHLKVQIFYYAEKVRSENWRNNKPFMERVIPIFEALVETDPEGRFHRNYGQLGFALKDKEKPDYKRAEEMLSRAIAIRGSAEKADWLIYEANRAICRIELDPNFKMGQPASPELKESILADLRAAYQDEWVRDIIIKGNQKILDWLQVNNAAGEFA